MEIGNLCLCTIIFISSFLLKYIFLTLYFADCSYAANSITQGQVLKDGQTLISADGSFEFGFFSPAKSSLRYVGIWYSKVSVNSVVWVANRNAPIRGKNGSLTIGSKGNMLVFNGTGSIVWSSNNINIVSNYYTALLHNNGNLEINGTNSFPRHNFTCWQSFDHPTDTFLPGMRVLVNQRIGEIRVLNSWRSSNDPSVGSYSMGVDPRAALQMVIWKGSSRRWRTGHWNGQGFIGVTSTVSSYYKFNLSSPDSEGNMYFSLSPLFRQPKFLITWDGFEKSLSGANEWTQLQSQPSSDCDVYNKCGVNGYCSNSTDGDPICNCFHGFEPKYRDQWENRNWSGGCVRKTPLQCERMSGLIVKDRFWEVPRAKLPDFADLLSAADEQECKKQCSRKCSCKAYAFVSGIGCMTWGGELLDVRVFSQAGNKLYIRMPSSEFGEKFSGPLIAASVLSGVVLLCILFLLWKYRAKVKLAAFKVLQTESESNGIPTIGLRKKQESSTQIADLLERTGDGNLVTSNLPLISYNIVASATNFFSEENKLGQGGFGPVYKGVLPEGQELAVKKLSRISGQGMEELTNEIMLIAKLQHRNLVRILAYCIDGEEKMLVYEYMPNKSLDNFIFDSTKQGQLGWRKRLTIIEGIARGLLYLHRDSRWKIIHRDLKASNILLDQDMNPKISDFGMARIFERDQDHVSTNRIVGTYGYMSPEYAMEGFFSEKSDVYSFGVLFLEVITGRRNTSFRYSEDKNIVAYGWELWSEGKAVELVDPSIKNSCPSNEASRCAHISMLCVQDSAAYRPTMSQVVLWLESESVALPIPKKPTLTNSSYRGFMDANCQKEVQSIGSLNDLTISTMTAR